MFILGVRADFALQPDRLSFASPPSAEDVLGDLPRIRSTLTREEDSAVNWVHAVSEIVTFAWFRQELTNGLAQTAKLISRTISQLSSERLSTGGPYRPYERKPARLREWYTGHSEGVADHESRAHMRADLHRYLFAAAYASVNGSSPFLRDFPPQLLPAHRNVPKALGHSMFADRFRVQVADQPATTVTSHLAKDGHFFIHYDPAQCRSLTVREAARLQTFPDDYHFEGDGRGPKYQQIGNAVPPYLALQIAEIVYDVLRRLRM